jgi:hypothetical protein
MSCTRFGPALAAHAAGAAIEPAAERHLGECAACRRMLDTQVQLLAELDGELGRTLSLSASSDFAARAARQARDAGEATAHPWIPVPVWAGLGVAAVILLAISIPQTPGNDPAFRPFDRPRAVPGLVEGRPKTEATVPRAGDVLLNAESTASPKLPPSGARRAAPRRSTTHSPGVRPTVGAEPPVIVEPSRAMAIHRLRELMTEGRLDEKMLPPPATPETVLAELTIAPLQIAEIRVRDVEIAGRPPAAPERQ